MFVKQYKKCRKFQAGTKKAIFSEILSTEIFQIKKWFFKKLIESIQMIINNEDFELQNYSTDTSTYNRAFEEAIHHPNASQLTWDETYSVFK